MDTLPQRLGQRQEILAFGAVCDLLLGNRQLSIEVNQRLLALILLHAEDHHIAGAIPGDIHRLSGLAAEVGDLIGAVSKFGNGTNTWHERHLLASNSIAKF